MNQEINNSVIAKKMAAFCDEITNVINEIGQSFHGKTNRELGVIRVTFMTICERVSRNLHGVVTLLNSEDNHLENNRQPIMLLLRGIIEDLWLGAYLMRLRDDEVSFVNELNVISIDYLKFSEFLIKRGPYYSFVNKDYEGLSEPEINAKIEEKIVEFRRRYSGLYNEKDGQYKPKTPQEIRASGNPSHLILRNSSGEEIDLNKKPYSVSFLNEIIEYVGIGQTESLKIYSYTYHIYRTLSQYQHFSLDVSINVLNKANDYEVFLIDRAISSSYMILTQLLPVLGISEPQNYRLYNAYNVYIKDNPQYDESTS